jgi:hypothetical protein
MKQTILYFFSFLLLLYILSIENYENNNIRSDRPDDKQYYACRSKQFTNNPDYPFQEYPDSNYRVVKNSVEKPLKGTYSAFLDTNKIRTYNHFYHSPICENDYSFENDIDSQFRLIPGAFPEEDISRIYENEKRKDSKGVRNPYYLYGNPNFIENKVLYDEELQDMFIRVKLGMPLHHEDDSHLEGIDSSYDP